MAGLALRDVDRRGRVLVSGMKPSGEPHLGNLAGMMRPLVALAARHEAYVLVADLHALTTVRDAGELHAHVHDVTAGLLAAGLDPARTALFRQSDVPEILELAWTLACLAPVGLLERAHAFKAAAGERRVRSVGLFTYPILMAADILAFQGDLVPVGPDQQQHVEMARDLARRFNQRYANLFAPPDALDTSRDLGSLPGLDGRKMSKHYGNTIPLSAGDAERRGLIRRIVTDSSGVGAPKDPSASPLVRMFRAFASDREIVSLEARLRNGEAGWRDAKDELADVLEREVGPVQRRYAALRPDESALDEVLGVGAERAGRRARETLAAVRSVIGTGARGRDDRTTDATDPLDDALRMTFPASDPIALNPGRLRRGRTMARRRQA